MFANYIPRNVLSQTSHLLQCNTLQCSELNQRQLSLFFSYWLQMSLSTFQLSHGRCLNHGRAFAGTHPHAQWLWQNFPQHLWGSHARNLMRDNCLTTHRVLKPWVLMTSVLFFPGAPFSKTHSRSRLVADPIGADIFGAVERWYIKTCWSVSAFALEEWIHTRVRVWHTFCQRNSLESILRIGLSFVSSTA